MCKVVNQILSIKMIGISQSEQYFYARSITNPKFCLNRNHYVVAFVYEITRVLLLFSVVAVLPIDYYYVGLSIFLGLRILPFLFALITLESRDDKFERFRLEMAESFKSTTLTYLIIAILMSIIQIFVRGFNVGAKNMVGSIVVLGLIVITIWLMNGGPRRLIEKLSKLFKERSKKLNPAFQN